MYECLKIVVNSKNKQERAKNVFYEKSHISINLRANLVQQYGMYGNATLVVWFFILGYKGL